MNHSLATNLRQGRSRNGTIGVIAIVALIAITGCGSGRSDTQRIMLRSEAVGRDMVYGVVLPRNYDAGERRYPTVFLLHGLGGAWYQWVAAGAAKDGWRDELVLVLVDAGNSWYFNWPDAEDVGPDGMRRVVQRNRWEDYLVKELLPDVDRRFRTDPARRGICGFSMGGYGGALLALKHPQTFRAAALLAGPYESARNLKSDLAAGKNIQIEHRERLPRKRDGHIHCPGFESQDERTPLSRLPEDPAFYDAHDPFKLAAQLRPADAPRLFLACGTKDELLPQSQRFIEALRTAGIAVEEAHLPHGHDRKFVLKSVPKAMSFLATQLGTADGRDQNPDQTGGVNGISR